MNYCKHLITSIRMSKLYIFFSIAQVTLSLTILIYILIDPIQNLHHKFVLQLELVLTITILIDISIRIISQRKLFFKDKWNIVDLVSFLIILTLLLIFLVIQNEFFAAIDDIIGLIVMVLRYLIQIIRLVLVIKQSHQVTQLQQIDDIKFDNVKSDETSEKNL